MPNMQDEDAKRHLPGMYQTWFLDYASYVNLDRAIPHINDGLKPVQRRVLHAMKRLDDGRYNKVANIVGSTMQFHPHGDASIYTALVNLGQKNLLIDCQGNWGNILTGDDAAAPRYIEARLSKFALEAVFNPKTTPWKPSYDGRNQEPISLPVKFPLLLAQGCEGIGLGLNSKIMPHNFNELIDASIAVLRNEPFQLFPDFPTGGLVDVSRYNDGERGGVVKIRAHIEKLDNKTLVIKDIPYGLTTGALIETIVSADEKGKINIKKVEDHTSAGVEILVHLEAKTSSDKTIDALYAFTKCEVSYSPNCCVVDDNKPCFITVSEVLRRNTAQTVRLLTEELNIEMGELENHWHWTSLEKLFFEKRIYKILEQDFPTWDDQLTAIERGFDPYRNLLRKPITRDDVMKLCEKPVRKISKFDIKKADEDIANTEAQMKQVQYHLEHIVDYAIDWFTHLKEKYGKAYPRLTEIRNFETIQAAKVVEANAKLYVNRTEGFIGTGLKKDDNVEFVCNCSDIDDIIVFFKDGKYKVVKVAEKAYVGKDIIHVAVYLKNDQRTIYNVVYRDGRAGAYYIKRFAVSSVTRDKEYDLTKGAPNSKIVYFTANANGEAETIKVTLRPTTRRIKNLVFEKDFSEIAIKGRQSMGNILTKFDVHKILLKQKGGSTLGGTPIWFDADVLRLNIDKRGQYIGEFFNDDMILVITKNGDFYTTNFDLNNHYDDDILRIEKFDVGKVWSAALYDAEQGFAYLKRFTFEVQKNRTSFIGDSKLSRLFALSDQVYPRFRVTLGGGDSFREPFEIDGETFIAVKSYKAKGKRLTTWTVENVEELEPLRMPADKPTADAAQPDGETPQTASATEPQPEIVSVDTTKNDDADTQHIEIVTIDTTRNDTDTTTPSDGDDIDEITGQLTLF
ncbi:MAG: DNA gyrase/topoisomerase IV subunit A [Bacteroidales bacterium]|nr:DNA gyrase/topoisomerase IV subunit A [Bacteroidales bacterium]MDY6037050.1 DNA gyrase/topoisomerase IV subunit A [Paludibacteraceae bacterium]